MPDSEVNDPYRLPTTVVPTAYDLVLEPDLEAATFAGSEDVAVTVRERTGTIVLNAADLDIDDAWLTLADGTRLDATPSLDADTERLTLALAGEAPAGDATLHVEFRGVLNDQLRGFYRSTYTDVDGATQTIAVTQMEATHARRAFPCWDEPEAKATFGVELVVADGLTALSNGAQIADEPTGDGRRRVRFADTMVMSTYLVAFIVGPLDVTDPVDVDGTPLRIAHPRGKGHLTGYALEVGAACLRFFTAYYGIDYPGDKLDLVAVPDFAFGAMENLGCVTFREVLLLVDPAQATQPELLRVADVINHEIAHMWFGDLVTMKWWNGIWLNEAFATFMEMLATDDFRPQWDRWTEFGISRSAAFDTDALSSTRPIEFPVVSPEDAEGMFDILTYEKGAAVVRMLEQYLGADRFREGIRAYLRAHEYGNTETTDLWDAIEGATGEPVRRIMDTWIFQGGHPVVSVALAADRRTARLTQQRFGYPAGDGDGNGGHDEGDRTGDAGAERWAVPVLLRAGEGPTEGGAVVEHRVLLDGDGLEVDLGLAADWLVVNSGGSGFYRVRYPADLLARLTGPALAQLTALERYNLAEDTWASVLAGATGATDFLALARAFVDETDLSVWQRLLGSLGVLHRIVPEAARAGYEAVVRAMVAPALRRLGDVPAEGEAERTTTLRAALFEALAVVGGDPSAVDRAAELDRRSQAEPGSVDPAQAGAAVRILAAERPDAALFDSLWRRSQEAANPQDQLRFLGALADLADDDQFDRFLALTLDGVRTQDAPFLLRRGLANHDQSGRAWAFVRDHWDRINEAFPTSSIARLLDGIRTVTDPSLAADIATFLADHPVPQGARTVEQHLERMWVSVALATREAGPLAAAID